MNSSTSVAQGVFVYIDNCCAQCHRKLKGKMSKLEKPLIDKYWDTVGGTIVYEFCMVQRSVANAPRYLDALILPKRETRVASASEIQIEGQNIILIQAKYSRLGMYLMGQALFSVELMRKFKPASIHSIALCTKDDAVLSPFLAPYSEVEVITISL